MDVNERLASVYYKLILNKVKTLSDVPEYIRNDVELKLEENGVLQ